MEKGNATPWETRGCKVRERSQGIIIQKAGDRDGTYKAQKESPGDGDGANEAQQQRAGDGDGANKAIAPPQATDETKRRNNRGGGG